MRMEDLLRKPQPAAAVHRLDTDMNAAATDSEHEEVRPVCGSRSSTPFDWGMRLPSPLSSNTRMEELFWSGKEKEQYDKKGYNRFLEKLEASIAITEVWVHLFNVNAQPVDRGSWDDKSRRPNSRKRNSPTTTARKGGNFGETRPFAPAVRVTHVTTHGFRKPPMLYVSKDAELFHQDVR